MKKLLALAGTLLLMILNIFQTKELKKDSSIQQIAISLADSGGVDNCACKGGCCTAS